MMVFLWIGNTYYILAKYLEFDVSVQIDLTSNRILDFPAVTVCNQNSVRKSALDGNAKLSTSLVCKYIFISCKTIQTWLKSLLIINCYPE